MAAIINSAPDCVVSATGTEEARVEDSADFVLGNNYEECAGFMTFGPGSTYGPEGEAANTAYMVLTWIGIAFMVFVLWGACWRTGRLGRSGGARAAGPHRRSFPTAVGEAT